MPTCTKSPPDGGSLTFCTVIVIFLAFVLEAAGIGIVFWIWYKSFVLPVTKTLPTCVVTPLTVLKILNLKLPPLTSPLLFVWNREVTPTITTTSVILAPFVSLKSLVTACSSLALVSSLLGTVTTLLTLENPTIVSWLAVPSLASVVKLSTLKL